MQHVMLVLAGIGFLALGATASLGKDPEMILEQDITEEAKTKMEQAPEQTVPEGTVPPEGEPAAESAVRSSSTEQRRDLEQERKRGLDRADEAAGEHGKHGRDMAREKGRR